MAGAALAPSRGTAGALDAAGAHRLLIHLLELSGLPVTARHASLALFGRLHKARATRDGGVRVLRARGEEGASVVLRV